METLIAPIQETQNTASIGQADSFDLVERLIANAVPFRHLELNDENFNKDFTVAKSKGKISTGTVKTPVGIVKINKNQVRKLEAKLREHFFGLIKPTLEDPLLVVTSKDKNGFENEAFVKTFVEGNTIFFVSFVKTDREFHVISNHARRATQIKKMLNAGKVIYKNSRITALSGVTNIPEPTYRTLLIGLRLTSGNKGTANKAKNQAPKVLPEISIIRKYISFHSKVVSRRMAVRLQSELKRTINERSIRKSSLYAAEIETIKEQLHKLVNVMGDSAKVEIEKKSLDHYKALAKVYKPNRPKLKPKSKSNGLAGLDGIVSSEDIARMKFKITRFDGKWAQCIGNPGEPFKLMIYGVPGQGKSTLAIQFANYLASKHNKKVLYIAGEEKVGYTLQEKINRLNAAHPNLMAASSLPNEAILKKFDVVFFDSVNTLNVLPEQLREITDKNPKMSIVYLLQTTKEGDFRGSQEYEHDSDAVLEVTNFVAKPGKNRFGGKEPVKVI